MPRIDRPIPLPAAAKTEARKAIDQKLRNDGVVDLQETKDLVRGWTARPLTDQAKLDITDAFKATQTRFTGDALATMSTFISSLRIAGPSPRPQPLDTDPLVNDPLKPVVPANTAKLSWTPPTTNTDGTPLTDLAGYKVYYGPSPGNYTNSKTITGQGVNTATVDNLPPGTWYFSLKAFDAAGNESAFSNEASKTIQ